MEKGKLEKFFMRERCTLYVVLSNVLVGHNGKSCDWTKVGKFANFDFQDFSCCLMACV